MRHVALLALALVSACADAPAVEGRYSCLIRFQCIGSEDILARQAFPCALDRADAVIATTDLSYQAADERCGVGGWKWTISTCDDAPPAEQDVCAAKDAQ